MKIGILTYHRAKNYGAFLQAYGLCQRLNQEPDIDAEIIDFHMKKETDSYYHRRRNVSLAWLRYLKWLLLNFKTFLFEKRMYPKFDEAVTKLPLSSEHVCSNEIAAFQKLVKDQYDLIIVGSDEVWKADAYRGFPTPYWLPGDLGCIKVSYAASSRTDFSKLGEDVIEEIAGYLNDFSYISVRDSMTKFNIDKYIHPAAEVVQYSDPSFVYDYHPDPERGRALLRDRAKADPGKKICIVMIGKANAAVTEQIRRELSDEYQMIAVFERHDSYNNLWNLDPFDWVDVIAAADLVCASFFHAVCFSIICHTQFLAFNVDNKISKLYDVLDASNNLFRLIENNAEFYTEGFLKDKTSNIISCEMSDDYVTKCREEFEEYIAVLRGLQ